MAGLSPRQLATTTRWVEQLNKLAREMDDVARAIHPSAIRETLAPQRRRYEELARRGPAK